MAGLRDFLLRFRPVGSPGRASPGGVPADRTAELAAELEPPLALLEGAEDEARHIRNSAAREAAAKRRAAERRAEEIVEHARDRAREVRATSAARVRRDAETEAAELLATAQREAAAVRRRAEERMPALLDRVARLVAEDIGTPRTPTGEPPSSGGPDSGRRDP
ncbi:hypothetical protein HUT19_01495 [Streptomyces sp. NA02950]|uniref:hypothetical protein n=1 Tax=Streptomyces sp. NA02950 TaxID=2742137 RepID=UPI001592003C|nr:hypothetical protein [Streptomyces sp. NA02950]QKV90602.1 hypothetical protein HUT19_01495 [Streptomyces sp. NA02950]